MPSKREERLVVLFSEEELAAVEKAAGDLPPSRFARQLILDSIAGRGQAANRPDAPTETGRLSEKRKHEIAKRLFRRLVPEWENRPELRAVCEAVAEIWPSDDEDLFWRAYEGFDQPPNELVRDALATPVA